MATICVDAGTSVVKAVVFDDVGTELSMARRVTSVQRPRPGFAEQDMSAVADAVMTVIEECGAGADVDVVAVTGQGDGCWLVDPNGQPTGPAVLWNDARAADVVERWRASGVLEAGVAQSGSTTFAGLPHAILAWFHEHDPERLRRSGHALTCTSWVFHKLTGVIGLDASEASNPFFSVNSQDYDESLLELYGVEWARYLLPEVIRDDSRVAQLTPAAARRTGLRSGIPVVMAPFDVPATTLGLGVTAADQIACILGTTLSTSAFVDQAPHNGAAGMTLQGVAPGPYLRVLASLAGTEVLDWFTRLLGLESVQELSRLADTAGGRTPVLLPYLSPAG
jgi:xylulokinase